MKKSNVLLRYMLLLAIGASLISCASNQLISNGAYSDISLTRDSSQYDLQRLAEIKAEGKAVFGIPIGESDDNYGMVVRFNGVNLSGTKKIFPILTLLATTFAVGTAIQTTGGTNEDIYDEDGYDNPNYGDQNFSLPVSFIAAIPIAGIINNFIWGQSAATSRAFQKFNRKLLVDNPNIDVFLNPKYEVSQKIGIFNSQTNIKGKVMGAYLK